ncbi:MAG: hypothetical protein KJ634_12330 [Gammaproteobacteria bacterium]|nr:hypothetical protein [Gammaproteobacteria bacterium]MBU1416400.1 hypothetical protein [Gammaproteobacteria bacterium]
MSRFFAPLAATALVAASCGSGSSGSPVVDAGQCAPSTDYVVAPVALSQCDGLGPGTEDCHFRIVTNAGQCCAEKPCDRLVVYWAGGNQTCETGDMDALLKGYADRGFVAACAQPYTTENEGGMYPYHLEFDRMNNLMQKLRIDVATLWTGDKLATAGTSHGGTAPLVIAASAKVFKQHADVWMGKTHTAMLLYDGISNPKTLEEWAGSQSGCGLFHQRYVGRYGDGSPLTHDCGNGACYCSNPAHASDWVKDTVVIGATEPPSPYTCADFAPDSGAVLYRFASCSGASGASPCGILGDIVPDEQQEAPYQALTSCSGVVANYAKYPTCAHLLCGGFTTSENCGGDDGVNWLEANGW